MSPRNGQYSQQKSELQQKAEDNIIGHIPDTLAQVIRPFLIDR